MPNNKKIWFPLPVDEYHDPHQENGVTIHSDGRIDIYDGCSVAELDSDQADMLYQALIDRARGIAAFIPETADREDAADALAGLDLHAVGNPMAEPGAVVASVPVPVKTGGATQ